MRMKTEAKLDGFSIVENCQLCVDDDLCAEHYDEREARLVYKAHSLVEQNLVEQEGQSYHQDASAEPSGHDWVSSVTRRGERSGYFLTSEDIREEFVEPTYNLADRLSGYKFLGQHIADLRDDYDLTIDLLVPKGYIVCEKCHFQHNKTIRPCPNCK